ncbi:MAG TPA: hypothetical protein QF626_10760 [Prochlorococcaceae cyanobacterium Fu_MAG_50]|nr:hypothetical protein [Prochlorococcaceae cyanobacterium Fu_MAG_50]
MTLCQLLSGVVLQAFGSSSARGSSLANAQQRRRVAAGLLGTDLSAVAHLRNGNVFNWCQQRAGSDFWARPWLGVAMLAGSCC